MEVNPNNGAGRVNPISKELNSLAVTNFDPTIYQGFVPKLDRKAFGALDCRHIYDN